MSLTRGTLLSRPEESIKTAGNKITVVGAGQVGMAVVFSILAQNITDELFISDAFADKLKGETLDLQHGSHFIHNPKITSGADLAMSANSRLCIVTAGVRQQEGESRLSLVQRNADVLKQIIPSLVKHSPNTIILMVSNPVDIMTYVAWKISGLPKHRVFGSGTTLDSARFSFHISTRLGLSPDSVKALIIGEHGDSSVPVWSGVNIAGTRLREINPDIGTENDKENWNECYREVVEAAGTIIKLKGYTNWAIGLSTAAIAKAICEHSDEIYTVSTFCNGFYGIDKDVCLSLPCVINLNGVCQNVHQILTDAEREKLQHSANVLFEVQQGINY